MWDKKAVLLLCKAKKRYVLTLQVSRSVCAYFFNKQILLFGFKRQHLDPPRRQEMVAGRTLKPAPSSSRDGEADSVVPAESGREKKVGLRACPLRRAGISCEVMTAGHHNLTGTVSGAAGWATTELISRPRPSPHTDVVGLYYVPSPKKTLATTLDTTCRINIYISLFLKKHSNQRKGHWKKDGLCEMFN